MWGRFLSTGGEDCIFFSKHTESSELSCVRVCVCVCVCVFIRWRLMAWTPTWLSEKGSKGCNDVMEVKLHFLKSHYYVKIPPFKASGIFLCEQKFVGKWHFKPDLSKLYSI